MSRRLPWYKRDVDAWRGGTRGMSIELRGFYSECLDAMWDLQGPIPSEPEKLAIMFCCNPRTIRKLLPQLVGLGKLCPTADGYENGRMMREIAGSRSKGIRDELEANSPGIHGEFAAKVAKNPMNSTRAKEAEEEKESESRLAAPLPPASREKQQDFKNGFLGGGGFAAAKKLECKKLTLQRAEGFGLPVEEILEETRKKGPDDFDAYFQSICRRRLKMMIPGIEDGILRAAFGRDAAAFTKVCGFLMGVPN